MINCNENVNNNEKQITQLRQIDPDVNVDTNILNTKRVSGKMMSICIKQH